MISDRFLNSKARFLQLSMYTFSFSFCTFGDEDNADRLRTLQLNPDFSAIATLNLKCSSLTLLIANFTSQSNTFKPAYVLGGRDFSSRCVFGLRSNTFG